MPWLETDGILHLRLSSGFAHFDRRPLRRLAAAIESDIGMEYATRNDWFFFLGYQYSGFYLRGSGSLIEEAAHGPVFQISHRW